MEGSSTNSNPATNMRTQGEPKKRSNIYERDSARFSSEPFWNVMQQMRGQLLYRIVRETPFREPRKRILVRVRSQGARSSSPPQHSLFTCLVTYTFDYLFIFLYLFMYLDQICFYLVTRMQDKIIIIKIANHHQPSSRLRPSGLLRLVRWDMSYDLELSSTQVSTAQLKVIARVLPR
jgi:hypothetical protein